MVNWLSIGFAGHHYVSHHAEMWWNREPFSRTFQLSTLYISIQNMSSRHGWYLCLHGWYLCLQRIGDSGCTFVFVYEVFSLLDLCLERAREKNQRLISTLDPIIKIDDNCENLFFFGTFRVRTAFTMGTWKLQWCFWRWLVKLFSVLKDLVTVGSIWSLGRPLSAQCDEPSDHASVLDSCLKCGLASLSTMTWFSAGFCLAPCFRFGHLICVVWLLLSSENGE